MPAIPFKTRSQLAAECGIHPRTVARTLQLYAPNLRKGQRLAPAYQKLFYHHYGWPIDVDKQLYADVDLPPPTFLTEGCVRQL